MRQYILGILGVFAAVAVLVFLLNYLNILPKFPGFPSKKVTPQTVEEPIILKKGLNYPCPVEVDSCLAEVVRTARDNPNFIGIGFIGLKTGTKIKAAVAGSVKITPFTSSKGDKLTTLQISDDLNKVEIVYRFKEGALDQNLKGEVSEGQILATLSDKVMKKYFGTLDKEYNLVLYVVDQENQEILPLEPKKEGFSI